MKVEQRSDPYGALLQPDLRDRVIDAALADLPARHATARFGVGDATAIVWVRRGQDRRFAFRVLAPHECTNFLAAAGYEPV